MKPAHGQRTYRSAGVEISAALSRRSYLYAAAEISAPRLRRVGISAGEVRLLAVQIDGTGAGFAGGRRRHKRTEIAADVAVASVEIETLIQCCPEAVQEMGKC